jgi:hypothetical protein
MQTNQSICSSTIEGMKQSIRSSTMEGTKTKRSIRSSTINDLDIAIHVALKESQCSEEHLHFSSTCFLPV